MTGDSDDAHGRHRRRRRSRRGGPGAHRPRRSPDRPGPRPPGDRRGDEHLLRRAEGVDDERAGVRKTLDDVLVALAGAFGVAPSAMPQCPAEINAAS